MYFEKQRTPDGIDRMFAVNVLDHFLLTNQLLDVLKESRPSRVITVAGNPRFLKNPKIDLSDIQLENNYSHMRAITHAMFLRISFAFELARRLEGTGVTAKVECPIGVYVATAPEIEKANGAFFDDKQQILPIHEKFGAKDGSRLWNLCDSLVK